MVDRLLLTKRKTKFLYNVITLFTVLTLFVVLALFTVLTKFIIESTVFN